MNRQRAAQLHLSPLHVQQGLFAVLALLITLFAGQQFLLWDTPMRMMDVDQAQPADEMPRQERWVF